MSSRCNIVCSLVYRLFSEVWTSVYQASNRFSIINGKSHLNANNFKSPRQNAGQISNSNLQSNHPDNLFPPLPCPSSSSSPLALFEFTINPAGYDTFAFLINLINSSIWKVAPSNICAGGNTAKKSIILVGRSFLLVFVLIVRGFGLSAFARGWRRVGFWRFSSMSEGWTLFAREEGIERVSSSGRGWGGGGRIGGSKGGRS